MGYYCQKKMGRKEEKPWLFIRKKVILWWENDPAR